MNKTNTLTLTYDVRDNGIRENGPRYEGQLGHIVEEGGTLHEVKETLTTTAIWILDQEPIPEIYQMRRKTPPFRAEISGADPGGVNPAFPVARCIA